MNQTQVKPSEVNSLLNGLIEICRDGQSGFADAAEHLKIEPWETFCLEQSRQRARYVGELQQQIQWLGGEPENTGSATGAIHRAWLDLKSALGAGGASVMAACETGEGAAVKEYESVLEKDLPHNVREVVVAQYQNILASHGRVKTMSNSQVQ